ncbi:CopG family ribbon-helix-helix protein [Nesterenkonia suensis]
MKTAISVPDATFRRAERVAQKHGMNRSQFSARAAERYADELDATDTTSTIDSVVDVVNTDGSMPAHLMRAIDDGLGRVLGLHA